MNPNPFLGVFLHAVGGFAAGSFYIPFRKVARWAWESYWLIQGVLAWVIMPWVGAYLTTPNLLQVLADSPRSSLLWSFFFGALWGIGGLTFGLSMRYLGMSLGYAISLGFCSACGFLIPPIFNGSFGEFAAASSGKVILMGVVVCMAGIAVCGRAGVQKERDLTEEEKRSTIKEFSFVKGFAVAVFAGVMSACMAFAIQAGKPISAAAIKAGAPEIFSTNAAYIAIMAGGFTTNLIWCLILNFRNKTGGDYVAGPPRMLLTNYLFAGLAGVIWYGQFFFYGMGTTQMGHYDFSSWTIHMAFIIMFSNLWGLFFHEWKGVGTRTRGLVWMGIGVLLASTMVVGYGNYVKKLEDDAAKPVAVRQAAPRADVRMAVR